MSYLWAILLLFTSPVQAEVKTEKGYFIEASFVAEAPIQAKWDVLTDYNNAHTFVSLIKKSTLISPNILRQKVQGRFWFFRKTVDLELKVQEILYNKIAFESVVDNKSFQIVDGAWEIKADNIVSVRYIFIVRKSFFLPKSIIRSILRRGTRRYIRDVREEIERRTHE